MNWDWTENVNSLIAAVVSSIVAGVVLLIRRILTNERRIALLEAEMTHRNEYRKEMDTLFEDQLQEIRADIKQLIGKMSSDIREHK